jgi:hypothetical protein
MKVDYYQPHQRASFHPKKKKRKRKRESQQIEIAKNNVDLRDKLAKDNNPLNRKIHHTVIEIIVQHTSSSQRSLLQTLHGRLWMKA